MRKRSSVRTDDRACHAFPRSPRTGHIDADATRLQRGRGQPTGPTQLPHRAPRPGSHPGHPGKNARTGRRLNSLWLRILAILSSMPPEPIRLSKLMAQRGICSRREADELISQGLVYVDGVRTDVLGTKVLPTQTISLAPVAER